MARIASENPEEEDFSFEGILDRLTEGEVD